MTRPLSAFIFLCSALFAVETINFAPLPKEKVETLEKNYKPFLAWLSSKTNYKFNLVMSVDYKDLVQKISNGEIDMAYVGPLPYAIIKQEAGFVMPIVKFLDKNGDSRYTCSIISSMTNKKQKLSEFKNAKTSLTQKYSTCGYYNAKNAFDDNGIKLGGYSFDGTHENVALKVLLGEAEIGSLQTLYYEKYKYLGLKKIYESEPLPGFTLIVNSKKLSQKTISKIQNAMTKLKPLTNSSDAKISKEWSENIKYGCEVATESDYDTIVKKLKNMKLPQ